MADNLLKCNFTSEAPYQKLSTDVSYISCTDGLLYLSAVKDLFNNRIIAHYCSKKNDTDLAINTVKQLPKSNGIIHSDQGSLYYSWDYRNFITKLGYKRSMSERGKCWQNSPIENWFSQLKEEWLKRIGKKTINETMQNIKEYIHWYNYERIQKKLNYQTPMEFGS